MELNNLTRNSKTKVQIFPSIELKIIQGIDEHFKKINKTPSYTKIINKLLEEFLIKLNETKINKDEDIQHKPEL